jgi:hypothetical protein
MRFGNVLETPIEDIWTSQKIDDVFRTLKWVEEPCSSCPVVDDCGGGCKVDEGCPSGELCIDRNIRGLSPELKLKLGERDVKRRELSTAYPERWRRFQASRYLAVTDRYADKGDRFFKTRYQTIRISETEQALLESILDAGVVDEDDFVHAYEDVIDRAELRSFVSKLEQVDGVEVIG